MDGNSTIQIGKLTSIGLLALVLLFAGNFTNVAAKEKTGGDLDQAADQYNKNKSNDKYKVVCKREAPVGSRIKKKVCRTVAMVNNTQKEIRQNMMKMRTTVGKQP
jgi:hypothetical protein